MAQSNLLPNFFIIGAAKSGTTTLYDVLKQHPAVEMSLVKEPRFFSNDEKYAHGLAWYRETYFQGDPAAKARGDDSPQYLFWSGKTAARFKESFPDANVKFVAIFREPVQRAYSHYWHAYRAGWDEWTFEQAVRQEEQRVKQYFEENHGTDEMRFTYLNAGLYAAQLKPFLERFPRESFLFLLQDDLARDFAGTVGRLFEFIGVNPQVPITPVVSNPATLPRSVKLLKWLKTPASPNSFKDMLKHLAPLAFRTQLKHKIRRANQKTTRYPPMDPALRAELKQHYVEDIQQLQTIIGRDLSHWMAK